MHNLSLEAIRALPKVYELTIPPDFLDEMGHMNVKHYLGCFDRGAWGAFNLFGITPQTMKDRQQGVFALEQHLRYLAEVHRGEVISLYARFVGRSAKRLLFMQFMVNDSQDNLACTFEALATHIDMTVRKTAPWDDDMAAQLDTYIEQHQNLAWAAPICGAMQP